MPIRIVTDSTSDIPEDLRGELEIKSIPLYINLNGKSYLDTEDITRREFFEKLPLADPHPTTAAPSPGQFIEVFNKLADEGATAIFSIHIADSLSAVYRSAKSAADQFSRIPVHAIDSGNLSLALGAIVIKAAMTAREDKSERQVEEVISKAIPRAFAYAKLDTIDYLLKGGRMSSIQHSIVGLLGIKPILRMNNYVSKMEVARTKSRAFQRVLNVALDAVPFAEIIGISHADAPEQVEALITEVRKVYPDFSPLVNEVNPALGSHVGPGTVCINWLEKEDVVHQEKKSILKWFS